eukprot:CAMPEP_0114144780 /NCGR_PEP_ID=MMETSP0043_2-20121206/19710_1 /TAXON_ID=464988 /ORGANISM="Hemiselmis andersenii, Strain CCMP644" /LENGTH=202 /DNA_ID=CAMNT_0001239183 /DNA_START=128 /DNA_END=733 /DNA_ORIENTATION=+
MNASALYEAASRFVAFSAVIPTTLSASATCLSVYALVCYRDSRKAQVLGAEAGKRAHQPPPRPDTPAQRPPHADAGRIGQLLLDQSVMEGYSSVLVKHTATVCALAAHGFASAYISLRDYEGYRRGGEAAMARHFTSKPFPMVRAPALAVLASALGSAYSATGTVMLTRPGWPDAPALREALAEEARDRRALRPPPWCPAAI